MNRRQSDWHIPPDWAFQLGWFIIVPTIAIFAAMLLPALSELKRTNVVNLFWIGFSLGCLGILLLFFARLPLYRQRQFFSFGPKGLPAFHRKIYWLAYVFVIVSILLLSVVCWRIK